MKLQLTKESINNALKSVQKAEQQLKNDMLLSFYQKCSIRLIELMNERVESIQIGDNVKSEIKQGWEIELGEEFINGFRQAKLINKSDKSVYVEFGVGAVGWEEGKHPNYQNDGYKYDVRPGKKDSHGNWIFNVSSDKDIDIPTEYILNRTKTSVRTKGAPAALFAYNTLIDFATSGEPQLLWEEVKKEFWGGL